MYLSSLDHVEDLQPRVVIHSAKKEIQSIPAQIIRECNALNRKESFPALGKYAAQDSSVSSRNVRCFHRGSKSGYVSKHVGCNR